MHCRSTVSFKLHGGYGYALALALVGCLTAGRVAAQSTAARTPFMPGSPGATPIMPGAPGAAPFTPGSVGGGATGVAQPAGPGYDTAGNGGSKVDDDDEPAILGLMLDGGVPDGAILSVGYRPLDWLRLHAGAGTNGIGPGIRIGAGVVPFGVGPSLTLEGGHYFDGNANELGRTMTGGQYEDSAVLERVGYDFANAHLGLELGGDTVQFFVHGGLSYIRTTLYNVSDLFSEPIDSASATTVRVESNPTVVGVIPSAKLGLVVFFI